MNNEYVFVYALPSLSSDIPNNLTRLCGLAKLDEKLSKVEFFVFAEIMR